MSKVLVLRTCSADYTSYKGFRWPKEGYVECPDWNPKPVCGGGLHGLLWGRGNWSLLDDRTDVIWQVVEVEADSIVEIDEQKVKFPRGRVIYSGSMAEAVTMVLCHHENNSVDKVSRGPFSTSASIGKRSTASSIGNYSTTTSCGEHSIAASSGQQTISVSAGCRSRAASCGDYSKSASSGNSSVSSSSGDYSTSASSGDYSRASSGGNRSKSASSGYKSTAASSGNGSAAASSGECSQARATGKDTIAMAAGLDCIVSAGENGCFAAAWYDPRHKRNRIKVGYVGRRGIKPDTPYRLTHDGRWEEVREV